MRVRFAGSLLSLIVAVLAALPVAACAAPSDADPSADPAAGVDSSSDAIVGGKETFARPEVGAFWHGNQLCTGTLIRPNVVITALHCTGLAVDQDVSAAAPIYRFVIKRSATERFEFKIDRLHAIGTLADMDGTNRWRQRDIALLRLTTDVPSSVAVPAAIATSWPRIGSTISVFGYGCTSRTPGADGHRPGTGLKRTRDYYWTLGLAIGWNDTTSSCPGDSGGPLLDVEHNAVVGTASGYGANDDFWGDVPANYTAVNAIASKWWPRR
jgi:hypothetical protein